MLPHEPKALNRIRHVIGIRISDDQCIKYENGLMGTSGFEKQTKERGRRVLSLTRDDEIDHGLRLSEHFMGAEEVSHGAAGSNGEAEVGLRRDEVEEGEDRGRREVARVPSDEVGYVVGGERREEFAEGGVGMKGLGGSTGYGFGEEREDRVLRVARWRRAVPGGAGGEDGGGS